MEGLFPWLFVGVIAIVITAIVVTMKMEKDRTAALRRVAGELGFDFYESYDQLATLLARFHIFSQGRAKKVKNLLRAKTEDLGLDIFDYSYVVGGGKNSNTFKQTIVRLHMVEYNVPDFSLRPENIFHRIGGWMGYQDINFDTHPKFSKTFLLRGSNEEAIRRLFQPSLLEFFESRPGLSVEADGSQVIVYRDNRRSKPQEIRGLMEEAFAVKKAILTAWGKSPEKGVE